MIVYVIIFYIIIVYVIIVLVHQEAHIYFSFYCSHSCLVYLELKVSKTTLLQKMYVCNVVYNELRSKTTIEFSFPSAVNLLYNIHICIIANSSYYTIHVWQYSYNV